ncbi:MAG: DNA polymerase III subunit gamma/tau [Chloroflexi bacterium]|nr:DNA polymerase III subunit gamma/tau [Chloroflexota bacterium]
MAEQVLYRKWRPQRFADVSGQDAVVQTLRQAVSQGRVAHAYLFCGPRGTGKTTAARILAKALNCEGLDPANGPNDGDPDNTCSFCTDVSEGRALDLIEMDAASHRGIDDVRSMQERVFGAGPARGRAKVYIIDEVHMLTDFAFNALLKTLEEPAPWAYFVLCTTEPHKVLATIVSRCQRFDFRRIAPRDVQARLQTVCEGEGYACDPQALSAIARATGGSVRDALNILEQTALSYGNSITMPGVEELLGLSRDPRALELVRHVLGGDLKESLRVTSDAASGGLEPGPFHRQVVERLRAVLLQKSGVGGAEESADDQDAVKEIAASADWNALLRAMRLVGRANVRGGEGPAWLPLELAVIEAASPPEELAPSQAVASPAPVAATPPPQPPPRAPQPARGGGESARAPGPPVGRPAMDAPPRRDYAPAPEEGVRVPEPPPPVPAGARAVQEAEWSALVQPLRRYRGKKYTIGSLLLDCRQRYVEDATLVLVFKNAPNRDRLQEELDHPPSRQAVSEAIAGALGGEFGLRLEAGEANGEPGNAHGHLVRSAVNLGARVIQEQEEPE